ncbi:MAG TPA: TnsA endonuclease N-terminal domain-containing protein [Luteimonas sp.]|nr:TnsA endonuclease N-terminal domain-containing protein [Luteimonas sp.]
MTTSTMQLLPRRENQSHRRRKRQASPSALTPADMQLRRSLHILASNAVSASDLRVELPPEDVVRIRNLVSRATQRAVFKMTSIKLARVVQCESILESDVVLRLDSNPGVTSYAEQPVRIHYLMDGVWRSHIPDFVLLSGDQLIVIEVKYEKDVDDEVRERTRWMEGALARLGVEYRLLTEMHIRQGDAVQNALRLLRRARHPASDEHLLQAYDVLRQAGNLPLSAFGWHLPDSLNAICIAQLVVRGRAMVEKNAPLTGESMVWPIEDKGQGQGVSW